MTTHPGRILALAVACMLAHPARGEELLSTLRPNGPTVVTGRDAQDDEPPARGERDDPRPGGLAEIFADPNRALRDMGVLIDDPVDDDPEDGDDDTPDPSAFTAKAPGNPGDPFAVTTPTPGEDLATTVAAATVLPTPRAGWLVGDGEPLLTDDDPGGRDLDSLAARQPEAAAVPEPATWTILLTGLSAFAAGRAWHRRRRALG